VTSAPVRRLANVGLHVSDIERSLGFYRDLLGMTVHIDSGWQDDPALLALSGTPGGAIRIVNLHAADAPAGASITLVQLRGLDRRPAAGHVFQDPGTAHLAFTVTDLDAALDRARGLGLAPVARRARSPGADPVMPGWFSSAIPTGFS